MGSGHSVATVEVQVDRPAYHVGETVTGRVFLVVERSFESRGLDVEVKGHERVEFDESETSSSGKVTTTRTVRRHEVRGALVGRKACDSSLSLLHRNGRFSTSRSRSTPFRVDFGALRVINWLMGPSFRPRCTSDAQLPCAASLASSPSRSASSCRLTSRRRSSMRATREAGGGRGLCIR